MPRHLPSLLLLLLTLFPKITLAQWNFDVSSVEAYINDHKTQRSLLLARNTLEESNRLLHGYSKTAVMDYKATNKDLDKYTRAFDVIDVLYQSVRTAFNSYNTYEDISQKLSGYEDMLEKYHQKCLSKADLEVSDTLILNVNYRMLQNIEYEGQNLYKSINDLILYASGAAACTTSDLVMILESINTSMDNIRKHLDKAYYDTWRYIQVRTGYWKTQVYNRTPRSQLLNSAYARWRNAAKLK